MSVTQEQFFTVQEASKELDLAESTVRNALQEQRLPFTLMYGRKLISRADLEAYKLRTRPAGEKPKGRPRKTTEISNIQSGENNVG